MSCHHGSTWTHCYSTMIFYLLPSKEKNIISFMYTMQAYDFASSAPAPIIILCMWMTGWHVMPRGFNLATILQYFISIYCRVSTLGMFSCRLRAEKISVRSSGHWHVSFADVTTSLKTFLDGPSVPVVHLLHPYATAMFDPTILNRFVPNCSDRSQ